MKVAIRTDASTLIGFGHLARCLTLADNLKAANAQIRFVCRDLPGFDQRWVIDRGYPVLTLPAVVDYGRSTLGADDYAAWLGVTETQDATETLAVLAPIDIDWIVADHYGIGQTWQQAVGSRAGALMMIDDLANRPHRCELLLDQNYYANYQTRYQGLVPDHCRLLLGPHNALLRPEFTAARRGLRTRMGDISTTLVFYGGFDRTNETGKAIDAIRMAGRSDLTVNVVVGAGNPHKQAIRAQCDGLKSFRYHEQIDNIAELMARSDVSLGGGGTTTWERCLLGLPTVTTELADNQRVMLQDLSARGAVWHLGQWRTVTAHMLAAKLDEVMHEPARVRAVTQECFALMAGLADSDQHPAVIAMSQYHHAAPRGRGGA